MLTDVHTPPGPFHGPLPPNTLRVIRKTALAEGVCGLTLAAPDGGRLPDWTPGAHLDVVLGGDITRQYSLCGSRLQPKTYEIAVLREKGGRGGSAYVHERLSEGDLIGAGVPRNHFHFVPASRYLFVAGGIGITPILPMIEAAESLRIPWTLVYGGRTLASMAFRDRLKKHGERVRFRPQDTHGLLDVYGAVADLPPDAKIYCCGPGPLLDAVENACARKAPGVLRTERFLPRKQGAPVRGMPFDVYLARTRVTVSVSPGASVLSAMVEAGVPVLSSCRQGICGTCETPVLEGVPDHRDSVLSESERAAGRSMLVCVSRSCGDRLVLDA